MKLLRLLLIALLTLTQVQAQKRPPVTPGVKEPEQISQYIRRMLQDRDGNIWFGTNGDGVCRYDGKTLRYFNHGDGFKGEAVRGMLQRIWLGDNANTWQSRVAHFIGTCLNC